MVSVTRRSAGSRTARRDEVRDRLLEAVERLLEAGESYTDPTDEPES